MDTIREIINNLLDSGQQAREIIRENLIQVAIGGVVLALFVLLFVRSGREVNIEEIQLTIDAAATASNREVPTVAAQLTLTPGISFLTAGAPTLDLIGRQEVRQFAASATATSQLGEEGYSALQAVGPPNVEGCADSPNAWASASPSGTATLTVYFAELVRPRGVLIHQTNNPGFVSQVNIVDVFGERRVVYESATQPVGICPFVLVVLSERTDYAANTVEIVINQTNSPAGFTQIDAVELIGINY